MTEVIWFFFFPGFFIIHREVVHSVQSSGTGPEIDLFSKLRNRFSS